MLSRLPTGKIASPGRPWLSLAFFVLVTGGDAQVVLARGQIDLVVGARLFVLVWHQLLGGQALVDLLDLLGRGDFERHRLLRLQYRLGRPSITAADAGDRIILAEVVEAG